MSNGFIKLARKAFLANAPTVLEGIERVEEDKTRRIIRPTTPTIIHYSPTTDIPAELTLAGTATVFVAARGDSFLADLRDAYADADADRIAALAQTFRETLSRVSTFLSSQSAAG